MSTLTSLAALEAIIGKTPAAVNLKVIDHLDQGALHWIEASPLMFAGFGSREGIDVTLAGGPVAFASGNTRELRIPLDRIDAPDLAQPGASFCSLFLVPGIGETLRVNGRVERIANGAAVIAVEECYGHCAKALIRSDFWAAAPAADRYDDAAAFAAVARFMVLATVDADGHADLSPKGDPAGSLTRYQGEALAFAERPGNRRIDSLRNIVSQPCIAAALVVPGSCQTAIVTGRARISDDTELRAGFAVQGKTPLLATCFDDPIITLHTSNALTRAALWPAARSADIDPARMFAGHVRLNRDKGLQASLIGAAVSIPGLLRKGLEQDYKSNLY